MGRPGRAALYGLVLLGAVSLEGAVYEVGPGRAFARIADSPTAALQAGDTLKIRPPNPFNGQIVIAYDLPQSGWVQLAVYTATGQRVDQLDKQFRRPLGREETMKAFSRQSILQP